MEENESVLIRVKQKTKDRLDKLGGKNDTYDNIITRLLASGKGK